MTTEVSAAGRLDAGCRHDAGARESLEREDDEGQRGKASGGRTVLGKGKLLPVKAKALPVKAKALPVKAKAKAKAAQGDAGIQGGLASQAGQGGLASQGGIASEAGQGHWMRVAGYMPIDDRQWLPASSFFQIRNIRNCDRPATYDPPMTSDLRGRSESNPPMIKLNSRLSDTAYAKRAECFLSFQ